MLVAFIGFVDRIFVQAVQNKIVMFVMTHQSSMVDGLSKIIAGFTM